jgi:probable HAF family extracellular repeat protein
MYTFTVVNPPGSFYINAANGINDSGAIVGQTLSGAFLYSNGVYSYPTYPGSPYTIPFAINNANQIVGNYLDSAGVQHAYISSGGNYQTIDPPVDPSALTASANSINNHGQVVVSNADAFGNLTNYLYANGQFTPLAALPNTASAYGINDADTIVGTFNDPSGLGYLPHGFILQGGQFTQLDDPNAGESFSNFFSGTTVTAINDNGEIVGYYADVNNNIHGFIYQNGVFTDLDAPNASQFDPNNPFPAGTFPGGINNEGQIVGFYTDAATGNIDAFVATPTLAPEPASLPLTVAGGLGLTGWWLRKRKAGAE